MAKTNEVAGDPYGQWKPPLRHVFFFNDKHKYRIENIKYVIHSFVKCVLVSSIILFNPRNEIPVGTGLLFRFFSTTLDKNVRI